MLRHDCGGCLTGITAWDRLLLDQLRETKIQNLCVAITGDHDVVGLQIAMDNSRSVRFCQSFGRVLQEPEQLSEFSSLLMNLLAQCESIDKLHRNEVHIVALADF